jgi:hypothetical protein
MSNPSNLYAEKVYSEHPTVLWALDDQLDYISLLTETQRRVYSGWTVTNGTATIGSSILNEPFQNSATTILESIVPTGTSNTITCISPDIVNLSSLDQNLNTFCFGSFFYSNSPYVSSIEIGYEYTDTTTSITIQKLKKFETSIFQAWSFISETFEIPNENTNLRLILKVTMLQGGSLTSDYQIYFNGLSLGQWSEEFNTKSLGVTSSAFPANINITTTNTVVSATPYGLSSDEAYYLVNEKTLLAKNSGIPLVFGASNVTQLKPNDTGMPSIILPGKGFLNEAGRYKEYTVEFWAKINSNSYEPKRIFGPIKSKDGLYVESGFLTLVIGNNFESHFVGEWYRPMLINIRITRNSASLLVNGEEVISLSIDTETLDLPSILDSENNKENDWLGFYSYEDVTPIEVDAFAIYSYQVTDTVAKRRWVYGQAVISAESINSSYGGTSAFIDYPFADYTSNYSYPNLASWQQGTFDNLATTNSSLTTPQYSLPEIFLGTKTLQNLYHDCKTVQSGTNKFITFRPNEFWNGINTYINFPRFNILADQIHTIYGVFEIEENDISNQILFKIYNTLTGNFFSIRKNGPNIDYYLTYNGIEEEFYSVSSFPIGEPIAFGIQIQTLIDSFGGNIAAFFGNQNGLKFYVGGDETGDLTFTGKIYSVGLSTSLNSSEISSHFNEQGIAILGDGQALIDHTASYTLLPTEAYGQFFLDIGVSGYWEDYMPLSYFAQYVQNDIGNEYYDLDFLQFNIGYPSPSKFTEVETTQSWTYQELKDTYSSPIQKTYSTLDNTLFSGWNNYEDMSKNAVKYFNYDTSSASIRSYITFQYIKDGANFLKEKFTTTVLTKENGIVDMDEYPGWLTTKFEVVDNTLIYPTKNVDFNELAIVYHLDFNIRNVLTKPVLLKKLELASQAFNDNSFNPIGTRFGVDLFPYKRSGFYYDYKSKNPFSIYKGSTPYLYLNKTSGIQVRGDFEPLINRGISMPINRANSNNYRVSAMQMWFKYDDMLFSNTEVELFEINYKKDTIKFYIIANSEGGTRGKIYARNASDNSEFNGLSYYINGNLVREPVISLSDWSVLGIVFNNSLMFDSYLGALNLNGPATFNNIAYYQANNLQQVQNTINRSWFRVQEEGLTSYDWEYWSNNFTWEGVLVVSSTEAYGVNPVDIYNTYLGTNKIIIDDQEGMTLNPDKLTIYNDSVWSNIVATPL